MAPPAFSIVPFDGNTDALPTPDNGPYLVATKSGYFVHRAFHFGRVLVPTKEAPFTPQAVPTLFHNIEPKLPAALLGQAYSFFRSIYAMKRSEAMVDITWSAEKGYRLFVPPQVAAGSGVKCKRTPEHYQGQMVGTIHSHCDFGAFHSGTDTHDADGHDGLHITIGDVMKPQPSIALMISVAGVRWDFDLDEVSDGPLVIEQHPRWWENYVASPAPNTNPFNQVGAGKYSKPTTTTTGTAPKPTPAAPNPNTPTVVSDGRRNKILSIEELMWRFDNLFSNDEQMALGEAADELDRVTLVLENLGIDIDYELDINPWGARVPSDDDEAFLNRSTQS